MADASPQMARISVTALLWRPVGATATIGIGAPALVPAGNIAPVLAFAAAPLVFIGVFTLVLTVGLACKIDWRDESGATLLWRLFRGRGPFVPHSGFR